MAANCLHCNKPMDAIRRTKKFCSADCRTRHYLAGPRAKAPFVPVIEPEDTLRLLNELYHPQLTAEQLVNLIFERTSYHFEYNPKLESQEQWHGYSYVEDTEKTLVKPHDWGLDANSIYQ